MEPRIDGTDPQSIRAINTRHFKGEIRRWNQFFDLLFIFRGTDTNGPVTGDEVQQILSMMPRSQP